MAEASDDRVSQLWCRVSAAGDVNDREMREDPESQGDAEDDGAGLAEEDVGAVHEAEEERAQGGHAVLRQFKNEGRFVGLEDGAFEQPGGSHGADEAGNVKRQHDDGAQAEESVEKSDVGDEGGDQKHVNGQARRAGHEGSDEDGGEAVAAVFDGARGHDGGNGAGISGE